MFYRILADLVVLLHLLFIVFVVTGGLSVLRWERIFLLHLPAAAWGVYIEFSGGVCPLTPTDTLSVACHMKPKLAPTPTPLPSMR